MVRLRSSGTVEDVTRGTGSDRAQAVSGNREDGDA
jgi:hypothetical protein